MYEETLREQVSQGDVFSRVPFIEADEQTTRRAILLTHDCQYDKAATEFVLVAWVRPLIDLVPASQGNVRSGKVKSALYLPELEPHMSECFVDFTHVASVRKNVLQQIADDHGRIVSLTDEGRAALTHRLYLFFSR